MRVISERQKSGAGGALADAFLKEAGRDMTEKEFISCYNEYFDMVWRICYVELSGRRHDV